MQKLRGAQFLMWKGFGRDGLEPGSSMKWQVALPSHTAFLELLRILGDMVCCMEVHEKALRKVDSRFDSST